jgi:uncharacterized protein YdiU (UPF0061 family)
MDYGPFGWMEEYNPVFAKWTGSGEHFGFLNQASVYRVSLIATLPSSFLTSSLLHSAAAKRGVRQLSRLGIKCCASHRCGQRRRRP